jgi:hypothetical protein
MVLATLRLQHPQSGNLPSKSEGFFISETARLKPLMAETLSGQVFQQSD